MFITNNKTGDAATFMQCVSHIKPLLKHLKHATLHGEVIINKKNLILVFFSNEF